MDGAKFDHLTRRIAQSRRGFLKGLLGVAGSAVLGSRAADPAGACVALGQACSKGGDACCAGRCTGGVCACRGNTASCNGQCVDTRSDSTNCGGCGAACPAGQACKNGVCSCPGGTELCSGSCIATGSDLLNCGGCGIGCALGQVCQIGRCRCPGGTALCGGSCIPTDADPNNCGGCGIVCSATSPCSAPICSAGVCVESNAFDGRSCDDGDACTRSDTCQNGICVGGNPVDCAPPDACHLAGTCNSVSGDCSYPPASSGTPCGECRMCDGAGACVADPDPCCGAVCETPPTVCHEAVGTCSNGVCNYAQLGFGAPCGICHRCDDDGACYPLDYAPGSQFPDDCPSAPTCFVSPGFCRTGFCDYVPADPGIPCGDCRECDGLGSCIPIPCCGVTCDDPPLCQHTPGTCRNDICQYEPDLFGTPCGADKVCDGEGACIADPCASVTCNTPPTDCYRPQGTCWRGICTYEVLPPGSPCDDCHQCDGAGTCAGTQNVCCGVVCDDPPGPCFEDIGYCSDGVCIYIPRAQFTHCGTCHRCDEYGVCHALNYAPGSQFPVDCPTAPVCFVSPGYCKTGFCDYVPADPGTSCGDCMECDGLGSCVSSC